MTTKSAVYRQLHKLESPVKTVEAHLLLIAYEHQSRMSMVFYEHRMDIWLKTTNHRIVHLI